MSIEKRAEAFAREKHAGQKYGEKPFAWHLEKCIEIADRFGIKDPTTRAVIWLHDVVEDCFETASLGIDVIDRCFGYQIGNNVELLTRKEGQLIGEYFDGLIETKRAAKSKTCDRIANLEASLADGRKKLLQKYIAEDEFFGKVLAKTGKREMNLHYISLIEKAKIEVEK